MPINSRPLKKDDPVVDLRTGLITEIWLRDLTAERESATLAAKVIAVASKTAQAASIGATTFDVQSLAAGVYRFTYYAAITRAATTSSSLEITISFTELGLTKSKTFAAITGNTTTTWQDGQATIHIADDTPVSWSTTYASVGATTMQYAIYVQLERVSA